MNQEKMRVSEEIEAAKPSRGFGLMRGNDTVVDQLECWLLVLFCF
jgi:hypothetical protein